MGQILAPRSWGLDRIDQADLPLDEVSPIRNTYTGKGVNIYIVDTGINELHEEFTGRVAQSPSFSSDVNPVDGHGHGSHVAGIAAGRSFGVAPEATIVSVKVCDNRGGCVSGDVVKGVEWIIQDAASKNLTGGVICLSLGLGESKIVDDAIREAYDDRGLIVVTSAGNGNTDACESSPARAGGKGTIITVSSTDENDRRSTFSSYGPNCTDIFAPGTNITSAWKNTSNATVTQSGTSMAAPHVAGVAATLLQKHSELPVFERRAAAQDELFKLAIAGKVTDTMGSPNLLLQTYQGTMAPTSPTIPETPAPTAANITEDEDDEEVDAITFAPSQAPTQKVVPTSGPWVCDRSWYDADDGCDCECGGDPDCLKPNMPLYCKGDPGNGLYCTGQDYCAVLKDGSVNSFTPAGPSKKLPQGSTSDSRTPVVVVSCLLAMVALLAFVTARKRSTSPREHRRLSQTSRASVPSAVAVGVTVQVNEEDI
mmetsp:Transcript_8974/g.15787  ORF Transcript_8974/g.15787 Transcript_8974/m.15787 type:complete len:482 (+) Transcript_8974:3-1448(+)